jgi:hypothetical protein
LPTRLLLPSQALGQVLPTPATQQPVDSYMSAMIHAPTGVPSMKQGPGRSGGTHRSSERQCCPFNSPQLQCWHTGPFPSDWVPGRKALCDLRQGRGGTSLCLYFSAIKWEHCVPCRAALRATGRHTQFPAWCLSPPKCSGSLPLLLPSQQSHHFPVVQGMGAKGAGVGEPNRAGRSLREHARHRKKHRTI